VRAGLAYLWRALPETLARAEEMVSPRTSRLMQAILQEWRDLEAQIAKLEEEIARVTRSDPACQRLQTVPGVGTLAATAIAVAIGNDAAIRKGRDSFRGTDAAGVRQPCEPG
jgi:transposase